MAWHDTDMQRSSLVNDEAEMASALPRKALDPDAPPVQVVDPVSADISKRTGHRFSTKT